MLGTVPLTKNADPPAIPRIDEALSKVNLATKTQSPLLLRPKPGTGHPYQVPNATAFDQGILGWINNE